MNDFRRIFDALSRAYSAQGISGLDTTIRELGDLDYAGRTFVESIREEVVTRNLRGASCRIFGDFPSDIYDSALRSICYG